MFEIKYFWSKKSKEKTSRFSRQEKREKGNSKKPEKVFGLLASGESERQRQREREHKVSLVRLSMKDN